VSSPPIFIFITAFQLIAVLLFYVLKELEIANIPRIWLCKQGANRLGLTDCSRFFVNDNLRNLGGGEILTTNPAMQAGLPANLFDPHQDEI
jgi:hypothetical protein